MLLLHLSGFLSVLTVLHSASAIKVIKGHVGGQVQVRCSHDFAASNVKYFCKASCIGKDVLIESSTRTNPSSSGRFKLLDEGEGVFTVTISDLKETDSGTYYCGVQRFIDTYHQVKLIVTKAPDPSPYTTTRFTDPKTSGKAGDWESTFSAPEEREFRDSQTSQTTTTAVTPSTATNTSGDLVYIGAGLAVLLFLLTVFLVILIKHKRKYKMEARLTDEKDFSTTDPHPNHNTDERSGSSTSVRNQKSINLTASKTSSTMQMTTSSIRNPSAASEDSIYSNVTTTADLQISPKYTAVNLTSHSDDPHYSSVTFVRKSNPDVNNSTKSQGDTNTLYSTVWPVHGSHSADDQNSVIYSSVRAVT